MDPNRFNFFKVVRVFALFLKCVKIWFNKNTKTGRNSRILSRHTNTIGIKNDKMLQPLVDAKPVSRVGDKVVEAFTSLTEDEIQLSLDYFFHKASAEVKSFVHPKHYDKISFEQGGILYFTGRVPLDSISFECTMTNKMLDLSTGTFIVPLIERYSPLGLSVTNYIHWYNPNLNHRGVESTIRGTITIAHIFGVRDVAKMLRKQCRGRRYLLKKRVDVEMSLLPSSRLCVAPPYFNTQVDLCGHFFAYSKHNKRSTLKVWLCVFVCCTIDVCPVGGHNFHGKVERKIRTINETIYKTAHDARLSVLEWETLAAEISNTINNLPVAIGSETEDLEHLDLLTPNRLKLGRNNIRSPVGVIKVSDKFDLILQINSDIFNAWWETWLVSAVPKLVPQPKWFGNDEHIGEGDIVLFRKK